MLTNSFPPISRDKGIARRENRRYIKPTDPAARNGARTSRNGPTNKTRKMIDTAKRRRTYFIVSLFDAQEKENFTSSL
jgi:hypothetical protein